MFEVRVDSVDTKWAGAIKIGLTTFDITGIIDLGLSDYHLECSHNVFHI